MANDPNALTNMWMTNPFMFEPSQISNQFSNFNNAAMPWPPTYNTGAGGPVNAATGQPIQSYQNWAQANPGGLSLNSTPAAPQAPQQQMQYRQTSPGGQLPSGENYGSATPTNVPAQYAYMPAPQQQQAAAAPQAAPQAGAAPNNWQAAINALANPGNPVTPGATVPLATGTQPSGGVNNAFLQQAGAGVGMNQNFLNNLRAIQGRPQGT
jgi:hypothetical protein